MKKVLMGLAALCAVATVQAEEGQLYLAAGVGTVDYSVLDEGTYIAELTAGVQVSEAASVEVAYQYIDKFHVGGNKVEARNYTLSLIGEKSVHERLGLLGRVYLQLGDLKQEGQPTQDTNDLGFGLGVSYKLGEDKQNKVRLEYRITDPGSDSDQKYIYLGYVNYLGD